MKNLNKNKIISLTKITEPFLMVDNISNILSLKSSTGTKKINESSWFFKCHFTNKPVMPGTLIEEAMFQTIVATLYSSKKFKDKICLITSTKTNFYAQVNQPTILNIDIKILRITKIRVNAAAVVTNHKNIKIASGTYSYSISHK